MSRQDQFQHHRTSPSSQMYPSTYREQEYDYDYDFDSDSRSQQPPPPHSNWNSAYSSDHKSPTHDDYSHQPAPLYPPIRTTNLYNPSNPDIRPSLSADLPSSTKPTFASSVDLETVHTAEEGTDKPIHFSADPKSSEVETGWRAALWPNSKPCRLYIIAVLVETIVDIGIEGFILQQLDMMRETVPESKASLVATTQTRQPVYLGLFALAHVVQMLLAIDSVYNKNTLQFAFLAIFNFLLLVYGAMQVVEVQQNINDLVAFKATAPTIPVHVLTILVPIVVGIAEIAYIALGYQIWKEFGWKIYKFLGADRTIKRIYVHYQIFQCLLKVDIFFWVGFTVQWLSLVITDKSDFEFYATIVALPLSILLLLEGWLAARHENKWMMGSFMVGCVAGLAYFLYKAYRIYHDKDVDVFLHLWKSLLLFACSSIIFLIFTFAAATRVMLNFGTGLKDNLNKKAHEHKLTRKATEYRKGVGRGGTVKYPYPPPVNPKRMSIE